MASLGNKNNNICSPKKPIITCLKAMVFSRAEFWTYNGFHARANVQHPMIWHAMRCVMLQWVGSLWHATKLKGYGTIPVWCKGGNRYFGGVVVSWESQRLKKLISRKYKDSTRTNNPIFKNTKIPRGSDIMDKWSLLLQKYVWFWRFYLCVWICSKLLRFEKIPKTYFEVFYLNRSETPIVSRPMFPTQETYIFEKYNVRWCP